MRSQNQYLFRYLIESDTHCVSTNNPGDSTCLHKYDELLIVGNILTRSRVKRMELCKNDKIDPISYN